MHEALCRPSGTTLDIVHAERRAADHSANIGSSATMVARGKPAPDLFLYAAEQLRAAPTRCLVIEDSAAGIDAAVAAGMTAIGFSGGSHCGPEHGVRLQRHGAALVMDHMLELATTMAKLT